MVEWRLKPPEYRSHSPPAPDDGWRYGFVRNPWDRALSLYWLSWLPSKPHGTLDEWILEGMPGRHTHGHHWDWLRGPCANWLRDADWVGRFERRSEDALELSALLGRPAPGVNVSRTRQRIARDRYQEAYSSQAAIDRVGEVYAEDVELYGYSF